MYLSLFFWVVWIRWLCLVWLFCLLFCLFVSFMWCFLGYFVLVIGVCLLLCWVKGWFVWLVCFYCGCFINVLGWVVFCFCEVLCVVKIFNNNCFWFFCCENCLRCVGFLFDWVCWFVGIVVVVEIVWVVLKWLGLCLENIEGRWLKLFVL